MASWGLRAIGALRRAPGAGTILGRTPASGVLELLFIHDVFRRMGRARAVFIAAINGAATGGGCELALACDLRVISSAGGPIGQPEILLGLIPGGGSTQRLSRMLGEARAIEMILEGSLHGPAEAAEIGLVHRVVSAQSLLDQTWAIAERLARRAPQTIALAKRAVYEGGSLPIEDGLRIEQSAYLSSTVAPRAIRAMRSYLVAIDRGEAPAFVDALDRRPWQEGTAVDLSE